MNDLMVHDICHGLVIAHAFSNLDSNVIKANLYQLGYMLITCFGLYGAVDGNDDDVPVSINMRVSNLINQLGVDCVAQTKRLSQIPKNLCQSSVLWIIRDKTLPFWDNTRTCAFDRLCVLSRFNLCPSLCCLRNGFANNGVSFGPHWNGLAYFDCPSGSPNKFLIRNWRSQVWQTGRLGKLGKLGNLTQQELRLFW